MLRHALGFLALVMSDSLTDNAADYCSYLVPNTGKPALVFFIAARFFFLENS
jgi:hypothetical protein